MRRAYKYLLLSSVAAVSIGMAEKAVAGPEGGVVSAGSATINQVGKKTDIHQQSNKAILDWRSFDIAGDEHVEFHQLSSKSISLNRINDTKASQIDGRLTANGHVMLINPNGVVFGQGAQVDVGSLTATTADIDNDQFMQGNLNFDKAGNQDGAIVNHGTITIKEAGLASFVAPTVENNGVINARLGKVQLAAAETFTLDMAGDGLINVAVSDEEVKKLARNSGTIKAEGGIVRLTASNARNIMDSLVENTGVIEATSLTNVGGKVILGSATTARVTNNGTINVSGTAAKAQGGEVNILAKEIVIQKDSVIDASGTSSMTNIARNNDTATLTADQKVKSEEEFLADERRGGGSIKIGGDYLGTGDTPRAQKLTVEAGAEILNDGIENGDGGRTIFWSDDTTRFDGMAYARGGDVSGNGGFIETSGKKNLGLNGIGLTGAENGEGGLWLLDPSNVNIVRPGGTDQSAGGTVNPATDSFTINADSLETALATGNVTVTTSNGAGSELGDITVDADLNWVSGRELVLRADNDIIINNVIDGGRLVFIAGNDVDINAMITSNSNGNFRIENNAPGGTYGIGDGAAGTLHLSNADLSNIGGGFGLLNFGNNNTDNLDLAAYNWGSGSNVYLYASGSGSVNFNGAQDWGDRNLSIFSGDLNINAALSGLSNTRFDVNTLAINSALNSTSDSFSLRAYTTGTDMGIGDGAAGTLNLSNAELDILDAGFRSLQFGDSAATRDIDVRAYDWDSIVRMYSSDTLTFNGQQTFSQNDQTFLTTDLIINDTLTGFVGNRHSFISDTIDISADVTTTNSNSGLIFYNRTDGLTVGFGDGQAGTYHLSDAELDFITGFRDFNFGNSNATSLVKAAAVNMGAYDWTSLYANPTSKSFTIVADTINVNGLQDLSTVDNFVSLETDALNMTGAFLQSPARLFLKGVDRSNAIDIGVGNGSAGDFIYTDALLTDLQSGGFSQLSFGVNEDSGFNDIDIQTTTWAQGVEFYTDATGSITTAGDLTMNGDLLTLAAPTLNVNGNINRNTADFNLFTDNLNVAGSINGTPSTGDLTIGGYSNIGLGDGANANGGLTLSTAAFDTLQSDFVNVRVETLLDSGTIDLGDINWTKDNYFIRSGLLTTSADQDFLTGTATFDIDNIDLTNALTGTGDINFHRYYSTVSLGDNVSGGLHFDDTELNLIDSTFNLVGFNRDQIINIGRSTPWNFNVLFSQPGNGSQAVNIVDAENFGIYDATFYTNNLNLDSQISGSGTITFSAIGHSDDIGIGDGTSGLLHLSDAELDNITNGFDEIIFGRENLNFDINVVSRTWNDDVSFLTGDTGSVTTLGDQIFTADGGFYTDSLNLGGDLYGSGGTLSIGSSRANRTMSIGDNTGVTNLNISNADLDRIQDGFGLIEFGRDDFASFMTYDTGASRSFTDNLLFRTGTNGIVSIQSAIDVDDNNLTFRADEIDIADSLTGTGDIQLTTGDVTTEIEIGSVNTGRLNLTAGELANLTDGWNSITIGDSDIEAEIAVNEAIIFSDHTYFRSGRPSIDTGIDINAAITTIDNSDLFLYGFAHAGSTHPHNGIHSIADINVARDFILNSQPAFFTNEVNVGRDMTILGGVNINMDTDLTVGRDFNAYFNGQHFTLFDGHTMDIGGDLTILSGTSPSSSINLSGSANVEVDGDILFRSQRVNFSSLATISGNVVGTSNITFLEAGEDEAMELGGSSVGHNWQMSAAELATIQEGFNSITFGSNAYTEEINISGAVSFSDDVNFFNTGSDATIIVTDTFTTTDGANLTMESGSAATVGWDAINIDADMDIAGNLITRTGAGAGAGHVDIVATNFDIGGDWINRSDFSGSANITNLNVGGNLIGEENDISRYTYSSSNANIGGNIDIRAVRGARLNGIYNVGGSVNLSSTSNVDPIDEIIINGNLTAADFINLSSGRDVTIANSIIDTQGNFTIAADSGSNNRGNVVLRDSTITTNENDFTVGGGTNPLTMAAIAGEDGVHDHGVELDNTQITTGAGNISIRGQGEGTGSDNHGIFMHAGSELNTTTGTITLNGVGGGDTGDTNTGVHLLDDTTLITSVEGDINITGIGGGSAFPSDENHGIYLHDGADIISTGTNADAATITLNGTSTYGGSSNAVFVNGGTVQSGYGDIDITGTGTSGRGVMISNFDTTATQARIISTGSDLIADAADITIIGNGTNNGVFLHVSGALETLDGDIDVDATASGDTSGLYMRFSSRIQSFGDGNITLDGTTTGTSAGELLSGIDIRSSWIRGVDGDISLTGQGGDSTELIGNGHGISITESGGSHIRSTGLGNITLDGTAGDCTNGGCNGVFLGDKTGGIGYEISTSSSGDINITGRGGNIGDGNHGIHILDDSFIESTSTLSDAGIITLNGRGGDGDNSNRGIIISEANTRIESNKGDITLIGTGGAATGSSNHGVTISDGADIISSGTGPDAANIIINAQGGTGSDNNYGMLASGSSPRITSTDGDITITATGGGDGTGSSNYGYRGSNGGLVRTIGTTPDAGNISVTATGGNGINNNYGMTLYASGDRFRTDGGNVNIVATGNGTGVNNHGFHTSGTFLTGITTFGDLTIRGNVTGSGTGDDISLSATTRLINNDANSQIRLIADTYDTDAVDIHSAGDISIQNRTAGRTIGLGSGTGDLNLSAAELSQLQAGGDILIGNATTGNVNINNVNMSGDLGGELRIQGNNITIDNNFNASDSLRILAKNNLFLNGNLSATGAGDSVVLVGKKIINSSSINNINAGAGRFLTYVESLDDIVKGGLVGTDVFSVSYPLSVDPLIGNAFVFSDSENPFTIPAGVEKQVKLKQYLLPDLDTDFDDQGTQLSANGPNGEKKKKVQANPNKFSEELDADIRLVEAKLLNIEEPIIDFYDLCSYNVQYCR